MSSGLAATHATDRASQKQLAPNLIACSGEKDWMLPGTETRRFWVIENEPAESTCIELEPMPVALSWNHTSFSSWGRNPGNYTSHSSFQRDYEGRNIAPWFGSEVRLDADGREWSRMYRAVVNDFGDLVEVPR